MRQIIFIAYILHYTVFVVTLMPHIGYAYKSQYWKTFLKFLTTFFFQILALDLLKARVSVMPVDTRKTFIGTVLVGLIEKTTDAKVSNIINIL